ncbi:MAG: PorT family protein [Bacteroidales bacterium]|jgi:hypothetical protein|nr:PorT family protein [Bacteroidales bacterium]
MFKKEFLSIAVALLAIGGSMCAQNRLGVTAGYNLSSISGVSGGHVGNNVPPPGWGSISGFRFGAATEFPLAGAIYLQPSLLFTTQGFKDTYLQTGGVTEIKRRFTFYYLQVPVNIQYKLDLGIPKIIFQAGPYVGYGLFGRQKWYKNNSNHPETLDDKYKKLKFGDTDRNNKITPAFDLGVGVGAGVQVSRLQLTAGYNFGLSKMTFLKQTSMNYDVKMRNNEFFVALSLFFGRYESLFPEE